MLNVFPVVGDPDVLYVPDDYSTIQDAIYYAGENDTIVVRAGTYKEHIHILFKKRLTIVGEEGAEATIIDGIGCFQVIDIFNSEEITLEGFTITNASNGIFIDGCLNISIENCILEGNEEDGIYVSDGNSTTIEDCIIRDNGEDGIYIGWSEEVVIRRCDIVNNTDDGLYLWSVFDALIEDVNSSDNYKNGFYLRDSRDLSISYCQAYNNNDDGFHLWGISNASMVGCVAYLNDDDGIQVFSSNNILISGCEGYHNLYGFSVSDSYDIWLLGVEGYNNSQDGLSIGGSDRICISNSQFAENDDDGLYSSASRIYISHSIFQENYDDGIYLSHTHGSVVCSNLTQNSGGIGAFSLSNFDVRFCQIENNTDYGIDESDSRIDARWCWWGDASGPYESTLNPTGTGDNVDPDVEFDPWLTEPYQPENLISDLRCLVRTEEWSVIYPSDEESKPQGRGPASVSDWLATAYLTARLWNKTEGLDTHPALVNQTTGEPLGVEAIACFGGPAVGVPVYYYELNKIAPILYCNVPGARGPGQPWSQWYLANGTAIAETAMGTSDTLDLFLIEAFVDEKGRLIFIAYGIGWRGTYAAGKYFDDVVHPNIEEFTYTWIIVKWEDANNDGFVNAPGEGDTYTILARGH